MWPRGKVLRVKIIFYFSFFSPAIFGAQRVNPRGRHNRRGDFFFFFCSFSPAIFGAQSLNPRGGRNTVISYVPRWGTSNSYRYGEWRKIITDFSLVSYGDTCRFKFNLRGAWPLRSRSWDSQKDDSTGWGYKFSHSALCLLHIIHWKFSALLYVPAKVYIHGCLYLGLTSIEQYFHCFGDIALKFVVLSLNTWDECHPKPNSKWIIYNSSTHVKFKYRDCPSCTTFLMQDSFY